MPIQKLPPLIANQIAAGEVVERPASVVKELLENAIDAGATRIQIDLERGGIRLIRITDNGFGIPKVELPLALARHATSKILEAKDLEAIDTLGFRGEALASISSVSKLTLSSKPEAQEIGWSAYAEGNEMDVKMQPHSLPLGSIVEVKDLFFNTPARQKFLKAERTEFIHIEEIVKRIALANPQLALTLKHNGKVTKRIPAANSPEQIKQRVGTIVGRNFIQKAIPVSNELEDLKLSGWLGPVDFHQSSSLSQYFFVNGRPVRDRTISHAVRQAYYDLLPTGRSPAFVLFLEVPADKLDVNVHPTKHEVRFTEARRVHDYIIKAIETALSEGASSEPLFGSDTNNIFDVASKESANEPLLTDNSGAYQKAPLAIKQAPANYEVRRPRTEKSVSQLWFNRFILKADESQLLLLDVKSYLLEEITTTLVEEWEQQTVKQKPILIPIRLQLESENAISSWLEQNEALGLDLAQLGPQSVVVRKVPSCVEHIDLTQWLNHAIKSSDSSESLQQALLDTLSSAWSPEANTSWMEYLAQRDNSNPWQKSKYCYAVQEEDILSWIASSSKDLPRD